MPVVCLVRPGGLRPGYGDSAFPVFPILPGSPWALDGPGAGVKLKKYVFSEGGLGVFQMTMIRKTGMGIRAKLVLVSFLPTLLVVAVLSTLDVYDESMSSVIKLIYLAAPAWAAVLWLVLYLTVKRIVLSRISWLARASEQVAQGQWPEPMTITRRDELANLEQAFNQMFQVRRQVEKALQESEARFAGILDIAGEAIICMDEKARMTLFNRQAEKIFGMASQEAQGLPFAALLAEPSPILVHAREHEPGPGDGLTPLIGDRREVHGVRKNGKRFPAEISVSRLELDGQTVFIAVLRDITDRKRAEEEIKVLAEFPSEHPNPVLRVSRDCTILYANPQSLLILKEWGCQIGERLPEFWHSIIEDGVKAGTSRNVEVEIADRVYLFAVAPVVYTHCVYLYGQDITERKRAQEALAEQAIRDSLTGLYNRRYFRQRIGEEIAQANRNRQSVAVIVCDLDGFKAINDSQGHHAGDQALEAVARSLQASIREADLAFRWGGDEFVVVLTEATSKGTQMVTDRIRRGVHQVGLEMGLRLDVSVGVALYPEHGHNAQELIRIADRALYIAKGGEVKIHIGTAENHLDQQSIEVVFQPIMDIQMDQILGYEALSRHPRGHLHFQDLLRKYKAIGQLDALKRHSFCSHLDQAARADLKYVFIDVGFPLLDQMDVIPRPSGMEVVLEISEAEALHDIEKHLNVTHKWRKAGYQFAVKDFGSGFVSLPFIARFIPDYIKVDHSTIHGGVSSRHFRRFSRTLINALQEYVGKGIIAEGIESEGELVVAKDLGIRYAQGTLLGHPREPVAG